MQQLRRARLRSVVLNVTIGIASSLGVAGCGSGGSNDPVAQAQAGHEAAKSSMEYMRNQHKAQPKIASKAHPKGQ